MKCGIQTLLVTLVVTLVATLIGCGGAGVEDPLDTRSPAAIDPALLEKISEMTTEETIPVIVKFKNDVQIATPDYVSKSIANSQVVRTLEGQARQTQEPFIEFLALRGAKNIAPLWVINAIAFEATPALILDLADIEDVMMIHEDAMIAIAEPLAAQGSSDEWNLYAVRAPDLWMSGFSGQGVVIANMDTGIDALHPDIASRWRGGTNSWYDPFGEHATPYDSAGHGTQAMGIALGGNTSGPSIGVAPDANWIAVKIFNDAGMTQISKIHQGFQWLLNPDGNPATGDAPDIVSNSWGMKQYIDECLPEFTDDIAALRAAGIAVVASAGNDGPAASTSLSPANNSGVISVGAIDDTFDIPIFSSRGPSACDGSIYPKIVAPGAGILTADLTFNGTFLSSYTFVSGTSFASAHVAGALALLKSAVPSISLAQAEQAIQDSALDMDVAGPDNNSGQGMLDVMEAYNILTNTTLCNDVDNDGFFAEGGCGTPRDCNDDDAVINPAADDIEQNGIDENCNGYDLTIQGKAGFAWRLGILRVWASSSLGKHAYLELQGFGPMRWDNAQNRYELETTVAGERPQSVIVAGVEGEIELPVARTREGWPMPSAPLSLTATQTGTGKVGISWSDVSANEAGFIIERSLSSSGPFTIVGQAPRNAVSYENTGLRSGLTYYYQVRAFNSGGYSGPTNIAFILTN